MKFSKNNKKLCSNTENETNESTGDLTSRQLKALETKKSLYESAIKLFAEKGFNNVTIDQIVAEAGTSKGSFYTYFKSKNHVFLEQFRQFDEHYAAIYKSLTKYKTAREKLLNFIKGIYMFEAETGGVDTAKILYTNGFVYTQEEAAIMTDTSRPLYKIVEEIIHEGKEKGEFRNEFSEEQLTIMAIRCISGTYFDWCLYDGSFDIVEDGTRFFSIFLDGMMSTKN